MAVPTVVSVTPNAARTSGGVWATIVGTNFTIGPNKVTINGEVSKRSFAVSATSARALIPANDPGTFALTLQNVNQTTGVPVVGEVGTLNNAVTYKRPDLTSGDLLAGGGELGTLQRATRALIRDLKREVLENVSLTVHTDYGEDQSSATISYVNVAKLPAIILTGPVLEENRLLSTNEIRQVVDGVRILELPPPFTVDMTFTLIGVADTTHSLLALMKECTAFVHRNPFLYVPFDFTISDPPTQKFEFAFATVFRTASVPNASNLRQFSGEVVIRGVDIDNDQPSAYVNETRELLTVDDPLYDPAGDQVLQGYPEDDPYPGKRADIVVTYTQKDSGNPGEDVGP